MLFRPIYSGWKVQMCHDTKIITCFSVALSFTATSATVHMSFLLVEEGNGEFLSHIRLKVASGCAAVPGGGFCGLTLDTVGTVKGLNFRRKQ